MPEPKSTASKHAARPVVERVGYSEGNDNHQPHPWFQRGTVNTGDTAGHANNSVREVTSVFDEGRAMTLLVAERAIDPEDPTPAELVVLPEGTVTVSNTAKTADEGRADVARELERLRAKPIKVGTVGPEAQAAGDTEPVKRAGLTAEQVKNLEK